MKNEDIGILFANHINNNINIDLIKYDYNFDIQTSEINYDKNVLENYWKKLIRIN